MSQRRRPQGICLNDAAANSPLDVGTDDLRFAQRRSSHPTHRVLSKPKRTHSVPLRYPPSVHPILTDFGPVTLQAYLQNELKKHKEEQEKRKTDPQHRARYCQRQEAVGLVNAPGSLRLHGRGVKARYTVDLSRRQLRVKDVESKCDIEGVPHSCNPEAESSTVAHRNQSSDPTKYAPSHRKARVRTKDVRVTVSLNRNFHQHENTTTSAPLLDESVREERNRSSLSPLAPIFIPRSLPTAMSSSTVVSPDVLDYCDPIQNEDQSSWSTSTSPSKIPLLTRHRASSFERHADSSRREQRQYKAKGKACNGGHGDDPISPTVGDSPRPRKLLTPSKSDHASISPYDVVLPATIVTADTSRRHSSVIQQNLTNWRSTSGGLEDQDVSNGDDSGFYPVFETMDGCSTTIARSSKCSFTLDSPRRPSVPFVRNLFDDLGESDSANVFDLEEDSASMTEIQFQDFKEQQQAILNSLDLANINNSELQPCNSLTCMGNFEYSYVVPEQLPVNFKQAHINRQSIWETHGLDRNGYLQAPVDNAPAALYPNKALQVEGENWLDAPNNYGDYPRRWDPRLPPLSDHSPPVCPTPPATLMNLPGEIWEEGVLDYLSSNEVRTLRLVCKSMAEDLAPYVFRSVVTEFKPEMFDVKEQSTTRPNRRALFRSSMLEKYGRDINKFGISFEFDETAMSRAPSKLTEKRIHSWYGDYTWPVGDYPYFPQLKTIDQLLDDDNRVLSEALSQLKNCSELALSVDSGYGWITGCDMSDLSVYRRRMDNGSRVFGKTFPAEDRWHGFGLREYFKWAQLNTINTVRKSLSTSNTCVDGEDHLLWSLQVRDYDSFLEEMQRDRERHAHTGGSVIGGDDDNVDRMDDVNNWNAADVINNLINGGLLPAIPDASPVQNLQLLNLAFARQASGAAPLTLEVYHQLQAAWTQAANRVQITNRPRSAYSSSTGSRTAISAPARSQPAHTSKFVQPQWPLIFNAFNVAAHCRGHTSLVQDRVATPASHPLSPGHLTETQAQWIMETSWIQRSFLSAYIDAVRVNAKTLRHVHSLTLAKISSGLLTLLMTDHLWTSLSGLRKVTILVKPDWRQEHMPGLKFSQSDMMIEPCEASVKFAQFLKSHISKLENLSSLTIGYCAGGEQQTGLFGRNQHILPAPITDDPRAWLSPHEQLPDPEKMLTFNHIRILTFQNCWFSPYMLDRFMNRSRDSSLRHLILDSVSITGENSTRTDGPLMTVAHNLKCMYKPAEWLQELVPPSACWAKAIDNITPGKTFLDRKYDADMIDEEDSPRPNKAFRGNVERITFRSCGYVKISGISSTNLNQNNVVVQNSLWNVVDEGLRNRVTAFRTSNSGDAPVNDGGDDGNVVVVDAADPGDAATITNDPDTGHRQRRSTSLRSSSNKPVAEAVSRPIMQAPRIGPDTCFVEGTAKPYLLGSLTQCIHPVEKRILEQAWDMRFGWGSCMERWEAVEDGWLEGGTGRFSGEVWRDGSELKNREGRSSYDCLPDTNRFY